MHPYIELQVTTNYSFLRGASHPHEFATQAKNLGYEVLAISDRNTLAGAVRMHVACKQQNIRMISGVRLDLNDSPSFLCFPTDRRAYGRLSQLLSLGKRRAGKGQCYLFLKDLLESNVFQAGEGQVIIVIPPEEINSVFKNSLHKHITSIGLYNHHNDLIAVAKLSKPVRKDEAITLGGQVKLDF